MKDCYNLRPIKIAEGCKMPKSQYNVLVYGRHSAKDKRRWQPGFWDEENWVYYHGENDHSFYEVTAWMPMPR